MSGPSCCEVEGPAALLHPPNVTMRSMHVAAIVTSAMLAEIHTARERLLTIVTAIAPNLLDPARIGDATAAFRAALEPDIVRGLVEGELAALAAKRPMTFSNRGARTLRLLSVADTRTEVRLVSAADALPPAVFTLTRNSLVGNAGRSAFVIRRWLQPHPHPNDVFDPTRTLRCEGEITLAPGDAIGLRAGYDAYDVLAHERPAIVLALAGPVAIPLSWQHRRNDGRPMRAVPAGRASLRLLELIAFADAIGDSTLLQALRDVARHPSHFVRWAAAKTALHIAPDQDEDTLRALAADEHPQVRAAAEQLRRSSVRA